MKNRLWSCFLRNLRRCRIQSGTPLVIALSGGPDSTALAHLLTRWARDTSTPLIAAHYVHPWPPTGAWEAAVAERIAQQLDLPLVVGRSSEWRRERPPSEAALRRERMRFLVQVARDHRAQGIALGHHRDDQVETFFVRLLRGSGPAGLRCMVWRQSFYDTWLVRPLLNVPKWVLRQYLTQQGIHTFEDPSNEDIRIRRNWVRHRLLPLLEQVEPHLRRRVYRLTRWLAEDERALARAAQDLISHPPFMWEVAAWRRQSRALRVWWLRQAYRALLPTRPLGLAHIRAVLRWLARPGGHGTVMLPGGVEVWRDGDRWGIRPYNSGVSIPSPSFDVPWRGEGEYADPFGTVWEFRWEAWEGIPEPAVFRNLASRGVWVMDAERVRPPGTLRSRRTGDRFQPLGMDRPMRLRRFLMARKVPYSTRPRYPVLETAEGIAAVLGLEIADWARVRLDTQTVWVVRRR